ncbi:hypothetical protein AVEN_151272-1 [Araneus ventricosus]|uniref:Uncharacterized protein n=1 Tax=Araneus ventricosus TaxID=182803 RepID=A0A4Y2HKH1_ARAVE|nr:hypothetical protein AVEN_151272-1 [Araneus ventricosus]
MALYEVTVSGMRSSCTAVNLSAISIGNEHRNRQSFQITSACSNTIFVCEKVSASGIRGELCAISKTNFGACQSSSVVSVHDNIRPFGIRKLFQRLCRDTFDHSLCGPDLAPNDYCLL